MPTWNRHVEIDIIRDTFVTLKMLMVVFNAVLIMLFFNLKYEKFEVTRFVIERRKSKMDIQYTGQKKKDKQWYKIQ